MLALALHGQHGNTISSTKKLHYLVWDQGQLKHPLSIWQMGNGTEKNHTSKEVVKFKDKPQRMNSLASTCIEDDQLWILPLPSRV